MDGRTYSPRELCDRLGISKSTLLRWERDGVVPPVDRDATTHRNTRMYTQEQIHAIVQQQTQQLGRRFEQLSNVGEKQDDEVSTTNKLQAILEAHSLNKLIDGNPVGLSELQAHERLSAQTIRSLVRLALEQASPEDGYFSDILRVACEQSRKLYQASNTENPV